jgi:peroxiredoxin
MPQIRATYNKFHGRGLEVIGISFDEDKAKLQRFLKSRDILWPQYFEGKQGVHNSLAREFGVSGIPHMFVVDKKGRLRNGNVRRYPWTSVEDNIAKLLDEQ